MAVGPRFQAPQGSNRLVDRLRGLIEAAEREGLDRSDMQLNLTLADSAALRRNRDLGVADLRYEDGEMWFLNVRVAAGGVEQTGLGRISDI